MDEFPRRKRFHNGSTVGLACSLGGIQFGLPLQLQRLSKSPVSGCLWLASEGFRLDKNGQVSEQGRGEGGGEEGGALRVDLLQGHEVSLFLLSAHSTQFWSFQKQQHENIVPFFNCKLSLFIIFRHRDMSQQMLCAFDANSTGITARWHISCYHQKALKITFQGPHADNAKEIRWIKISDMNILE